MKISKTILVAAISTTAVAVTLITANLLDKLPVKNSDPFMDVINNYSLSQKIIIPEKCDMPKLFLPLCPGLEIVVDKSATSTVPGKLYRSLASAIGDIPVQKHCRASVTVSSGWYREGQININTPIFIKGKGSLKPHIDGGFNIEEPAVLTINNLTITNYHGPAINSNSQCSRVMVSNSEFNGNKGFAIKQSGGVLLMVDNIIRGTVKGDDFSSAGVILSNGAKGILKKLTLLENESAGIIAMGGGTDIFGEDVFITSTVKSSSLRTVCDNENGRYEYIGGIISKNGSKIDVTGIIENSYFVGLNATLRGTIHFRGEVKNIAPDNVCQRGGYGASSTTDGYIRLSNFTLKNNDLAGIFVANGGRVDCENGVISDHPIGIAVQSTSFDMEQCTTNVTFNNNDRNVDTTALPVPAAVLPVL